MTSHLLMESHINAAMVRILEDGALSHQTRREVAFQLTAALRENARREAESCAVVPQRRPRSFVRRVFG